VALVMTQHRVLKAMLWFHTGFNADRDPAFNLSADPDPAFYLNADPDPGSQTNADPCGSGYWSEGRYKFKVFMKIRIQGSESQKAPDSGSATLPASQSTRQKGSAHLDRLKRLGSPRAQQPAAPGAVGVGTGSLRSRRYKEWPPARLRR
jgi:hypothetical protein